MRCHADLVSAMPRRFPAPWTAEQIPGGYKVVDATGQALAYVYAPRDEGTSRHRQGADDG